jgi:hypothetical protein
MLKKKTKKKSRAHDVKSLSLQFSSHPEAGCTNSIMFNEVESLFAGCSAVFCAFVGAGMNLTTILALLNYSKTRSDKIHQLTRSILPL